MSRDNSAAAVLAAKYNKDLGPGAIMLAKDMIVPVRFTTGSLSLDVSLGGGFAGNQWTEIYGPENNGKTAVTLKALAANQAVDPDFYTLWVASEHYDLDQAAALGVDTKRVQVLSTRDMAVAYDVTLDYLDERACDMVVIDSYPALIAPQEDEKGMDEYTQAEGAKMTNKFFRKVGKAGLRNASDSGDRPWVGIFVNQPREKIGGWVPAGAKNETTPGGRGKNFAFYTRLEVARTEFIKDAAGDKSPRVGQVIKTNTVKNKGGPPQRVAFLDFYFADSPGQGFQRGDYDVVKDVATMAILMGVVRKGGAWLSYSGRQWQGMKSMVDSLREEVDLLAEVEAETRRVALDPAIEAKTWEEKDAVSANTAQTKVRRTRKKKESDAEVETTAVA